MGLLYGVHYGRVVDRLGWYEKFRFHPSDFFIVKTQRAQRLPRRVFASHHIPFSGKVIEFIYLQKEIDIGEFCHFLSL